MIEDRLRPRYLGRVGRGSSHPTSSSVHRQDNLYRPEYGQRKPNEATSRSGQRSPQQRKARAIVAKYRRTVRYAQLYTLKCLVPAVKHKEEASEVLYTYRHIIYRVKRNLE